MNKQVVRVLCLILCSVILIGLVAVVASASNMQSVILYLDGYDIGKNFEDMTITTANEELTVGKISYIDSINGQISTGVIEAWKSYILVVPVSCVANPQHLEDLIYADAVLLDDIPAHMTKMTDTGADFYFHLPVLQPSGCEEISFDVSGYKSGVDASKVQITTKNKDVVIENVTLYADINKPDVIAQRISSDVYYCFAISFRAASDEVKQRLHDVVDMRLVDLEGVTPFAVTLEEDVFTVRFRMGKPGSIRSGAKKPTSDFELEISGYEVGAAAGDVTVSLNQPGYTVGDVSVSINRNPADDAAKFVPGVYNHVTVELLTQEDFVTQFLSIGIKLEGDRPAHVTFTETGCIATFLLQPLESDIKMNLSGYETDKAVSSVKAVSRNSNVFVSNSTLLKPNSCEPVTDSYVEEYTEYRISVTATCDSDYMEDFERQYVFAGQEAYLDDYSPMTCVYTAGQVELIYQLSSLHGHVLTFIPEEIPTCVKEGKRAHYSCVCGQFFEDAAGMLPIPFVSSWGVIAMENHTESDWICDAERHWKQCSVAECGTVIDETAAAHEDLDEDGLCDACEYVISDDLADDDPEGMEPGDVGNGGSGGEMPIWLSVLLAVIIITGFFAIIFLTKKGEKGLDEDP